MRACFQKPGAQRKSIGSGIEDVTVTISTHASPESDLCGGAVASFGLLGVLRSDCMQHVRSMHPTRHLSHLFQLVEAWLIRTGPELQGTCFFSSGIYQTVMLMTMQ